MPVSLDGEPLARRRAGRTSSATCARGYGIGRSIHVGETALGIKGRIGFEAGRRAAPDRGASRAREAGAHQVAGVLEGPARPLLRRPAARGALLRPGAARHRGAVHQLAAAGHRRDAGAPRAGPLPGDRHAEPVLDDGSGAWPPTARRTGSGPARRRAPSPGVGDPDCWPSGSRADSCAPGAARHMLGARCAPLEAPTWS